MTKKYENSSVTSEEWCKVLNFIDTFNELEKRVNELEERVKQLELEVRANEIHISNCSTASKFLDLYQNRDRSDKMIHLFDAGEGIAESIECADVEVNLYEVVEWLIAYNNSYCDKGDVHRKFSWAVNNLAKDIEKLNRHQ